MADISIPFASLLRLLHAIAKAVVFLFTHPFAAWRRLQSLKPWGLSFNHQSFLGMSYSSNGSILFHGFQTVATNRSRSEVRSVSGCVRSNITAEQLAILVAEMTPDEVEGIPPKCTFLVHAFFQDRELGGLGREAFFDAWRDFTFEFYADGKSYRYRFREAEVRARVDDFLRPLLNPSPNIRRKVSS